MIARVLLTISLIMFSAAALAGPKAPQTLVVVACKADDLTGKPGRHGVDPVTGQYDKTAAAKGWRDLELHINKNLEYDCKRELLPLEDAVTMYWPPKLAKPINPDWGNWGQCVRAGVSISHRWEMDNKGWAVVAIGCPSPIGVDADGDGKPDMDERGHYVIKGWKLPGCPSYLPGTNNRMRCNFDSSAV